MKTVGSGWQTWRGLWLGVCAGIVLAALPVHAADPDANLIAKIAAASPVDSDTSADISGSLVVWSKGPAGSKDLYLCDLTKASSQTGYCFDPSKHITLVNASGDQIAPAISGTTIVWQDKRISGHWDIYWCTYTTGSGCSVTNGTRITTPPSNQKHPDIAGNFVVWQSDQNGNWDLYMCDLSKSAGQTGYCSDDNYHRQIKSGNAIQQAPAVSTISSTETDVVWEDNRNGNWDIYLCNLSESTSTTPGYCFNTDGAQQRRITSTSGQRRPDMSGTLVVWDDYRNGNGDIYLCDRSVAEGTTTGSCFASGGGPGDDTHVRVTTDSAHQRNPAISGTQVTWEDERGGNANIYACTYDTLYDYNQVNSPTPRCRNEIPLTSETTAQTVPAVSGALAVWTDARTSGEGIYMGSTIQYSGGWNMVSVPHTMPDMHVNALFPTKSSDAFGYKSGYLVVNPLALGDEKTDCLANPYCLSGYWLKFGSVVDSALRFFNKTTASWAASRSNMKIYNRWNVIGSTVSIPVATKDITIADATLLSGFFGNYDAARTCGISPVPCPYEEVNVLLPGRAYWVKVDAGTNPRLNLVGGGQAQPLVAPKLSGLSVLTVTDSQARSQPLPFGKTATAIPLRQRTTAPYTFASSFDVRFNDDLKARTFTSLCSSQTFGFQINGATTPITIACQNNQPLAYNAYVEYRLTSGGTTSTNFCSGSFSLSSLPSTIWVRVNPRTLCTE